MGTRIPCEISFTRDIQIGKIKLWLVQSRLLVNPLEVKLPGNSLPPKLPGRAPHPPEVRKSPIVTGPVLSLSVRSEDTRSLQSSSSGNSHSSVWSVKLLRTSRQICVSRVQLSELFRRPARLTWSVFSRTPTCAPSTPRE